MLIRGANAVGYTSYPDNIVDEFVRESRLAGVDIFRVFDRWGGAGPGGGVWRSPHCCSTLQFVQLIFRSTQNPHSKASHLNSHSCLPPPCSLNYVDNLKFGIDSVVKANGVAEATLCYTGDVLDPTRTKVSVRVQQEGGGTSRQMQCGEVMLCYTGGTRLDPTRTKVCVCGGGGGRSEWVRVRVPAGRQAGIMNQLGTPIAFNNGTLHYNHGSAEW